MTESISFKNIHKLAVPALIAGIAEPILSITDTAIVGNMEVNATESLAAVGIVGAFISMLIWILGQTRSAVSSIVSQYVGANKLVEIQKLPAQAITIITLLSVVLVGVTYPLSEAIFSFYNAEDMILDYAVQYYEIRVFGLPFTLFTFAVFGTFRGLQNTYYPMLIAIIGAVLNIILDIILVYGVDNYIPAMHIDGAAYASVFAQMTMAFMAGYLLLKKTVISLKITFPLHVEMKRLSIMMLNLFGRTIALNIALYYGTSFATSYGDSYIAAYVITLNLWFLGAFILDGYSSAGNILGGKLFGGDKYDLLLQLSKKLTKYAIILGIVLLVFGGVFYTSIGTIFTKDKSVLIEFEKVFWIVLVMQPFCAVTFIFDGFYKGMGEMKYLRNLLIISTFCVFIPVIFLLDFLNYKLYAIWCAFFMWIIVRGLPLYFNFQKKFLNKS